MDWKAFAAMTALICPLLDVAPRVLALGDLYRAFIADYKFEISLTKMEAKMIRKYGSFMVILDYWLGSMTDKMLLFVLSIPCLFVEEAQVKDCGDVLPLICGSSRQSWRTRDKPNSSRENELMVSTFSLRRLWTMHEEWTGKLLLL